MSNPSQVPDATFQTRVRDESIPGDNPFRWQELSSKEIFGGKKVVLFALPGAFTPTCSSNHLPRYDELFDEFKSLVVAVKLEEGNGPGMLGLYVRLRFLQCRCASLQDLVMVVNRGLLQKTGE